MSDYTDDAYAVLGVKPDATEKEIKTAYRKLALIHHPDRQSDPAEREKANAKFAAIAQAYEILTDEYLRAEYDNRTPTATGRSTSSAPSARNGSKSGRDETPAPFRYHFSDPYEVFKRDFRDQFGIEYPGAKYDWVDFDVPTTVPPNNNGNRPMITNGSNDGAANAPAKKGFNPFRRKNGDGKDETQLVVRDPQRPAGSAGGELANPSCNSTALVLAEKKNNRPVSMDVTTTKEGKITTTVTVITRPDGSTEKVTMRTGIPGKAPSKNLPQLTNGERDNQKMLPPSTTPTAKGRSGGSSPQKPMLQLTNGPERQNNPSNNNNNPKKMIANGNTGNTGKNKPMLLGNGSSGSSSPSTAIVPVSSGAADTKPKRKLLGWGGGKQ